jgi:hypothetical protein
MVEAADQVDRAIRNGAQNARKLPELPKAAANAS